MISALLFTVGFCSLGLIALIPAKIIGLPYGLIASALVFFPGVFFLISLFTEANNYRLQRLTDIKPALKDGWRLFLLWAACMACTFIASFGIFLLGEM